MDKNNKEIAAEVSAAIKSFEKNYMGRGPQDIKTYVLDDMIVVRLRGILTPAEQNLACHVEGCNLIKQTRMKLLENARELLTNIIFQVTGEQVVSLHTDIDVDKDERIIIFTLDI
ncbi:DUF2294 domain-containing protein [Clostridium grantii]|uniref:Uncharacterized protein YbcI n=1 Tax=Clostridium grantii DSM 8605 TaxID=1121316 RepID=A0A1M5X1P1_9CLOT|nr:DUF2294 domain-containing protein [Clostridium grantii]SHH93729.1 Uncharacterized protein YbcI [Clostridium grantii DSM 8605]